MSGNCCNNNSDYFKYIIIVVPRVSNRLHTRDAFHGKDIQGIINKNKKEIRKLMNKLVKNVKDWARERGLDKADPRDQMLKVVEEAGEVAGALARNDVESARTEIGDNVVTLIILAMQMNMDIHECLNAAYDKIKNRKGKTINGIYIKDEDL